MAFEEFSKGEFRGKEAVQNRVALAPNASGGFQVRVSNDIYKSVGAPMFFKIGVGTGKHDGLIALMPTNARTPNAFKVACGSNGRGQAMFSFSGKRLGISIDGTTELPFEVTDAGIAVDLRPIRKPALVAAE